MDKWLRNNNIVKGLALLISILLWFMVHLDANTTGGSSVPSIREEQINDVNVMTTNLSEQLHVKQIDPSKITVILSGKDSALKKMSTNTFRVELDLSQAKAGTDTYPLKAVNIPSGVKYELRPQTVRVTIEEKQKKEVPIVINVVGTPADGYKAGQPIVNPTRAHVLLPVSMLDEVESVRAEVNIDKASSVQKKEVKLTAYGKDGKPISAATVSPMFVDVEVPITLPFKVMPLQVKLSGQPAKGYAVATMEQTVQQVTVFGIQNILDGLEFYTGPQVDLTGLNTDKTVALDIPVIKNKVIQSEPNKVDVKLHIVPSTTKLVENIPLTLIGTNDHFNTKLITPESTKINVIVEGAPELLDKVKLQDVQAIVDVSNLALGRHEIKVSLNLPMFLFVSLAQPDIHAVVDITPKNTVNPQDTTKTTSDATKVNETGTAK